MKQLFVLTGTVLLILLVVSIVMGAALGVVLLLLYGMSKILIWLYGFSRFEAMLLSGIVYAGMGLVLRFAANFFGISDLSAGISGKDKKRKSSNFADSEEEEEEERVYKRIDSARFYAQPEARTWGAWLQEEIANDIYIAFQDNPPAVSKISDPQREELAIRLGDIAVHILKHKTGRSPRLQVSLQDFKREMPKLGQRPYDDDILQLAVAGTNLNLDYYYDDLIEIVREKSWLLQAEIEEE